MLGSLKVALVHDVLINSGGAERVLSVFAEAFPEAPIFTGAYHPEKTFPLFRKRKIHTTFLQKLPHNERLIKYALPIGIAGVESFDFRGYDLVLSSSSFLVKGIVTPPQTCHICYMHNVFRLLWLKGAYVSGSRKRHTLLDSLLTPLRLWDFTASQRPDFIITNSKVTQKRIQKYYRREAEILHPPIDMSQFELSKFQDDYFLCVSRLEPYKRVDLAISAFNELGHRLIVVGDGSQRNELEKLAGGNIEFLGTVSDELLCELYPRTQALIFPGEEDFGIVPLEAQASGRPVIAYGAGGVLETATPDTGIFFSPQTSEALAGAVKEFETRSFDSERIREHARRFDKKSFINNLYAYMEKYFSTFTGKKEVPAPAGSLTG
ncbi:MAG: glycosyltransferase [Candidatus Glassbacteria bacterium]